MVLQGVPVVMGGKIICILEVPLKMTIKEISTGTSKFFSIIGKGNGTHVFNLKTFEENNPIVFLTGIAIQKRSVFET